jgi:hypothetical protein
VRGRKESSLLTNTKDRTMFARNVVAIVFDYVSNALEEDPSESAKVFWYGLLDYGETFFRNLRSEDAEDKFCNGHIDCCL